MKSRWADDQEHEGHKTNVDFFDMMRRGGRFGALPEPLTGFTAFDRGI